MYVLIGYDDNCYIFETFIGVFSTEEKAQEYIDNDYHEHSGCFTHDEYQIHEIKIDEPIVYK